MKSHYIIVLILSSFALSGCGLATGGQVRLHKRQGDPHDHDHEAEEAADPTCPVTEHSLAHEFNELSEELSLTGPDGTVCMIEEEEHHHEDETEEAGPPLNLTCESTFEFVEILLMRLNLTTDCCLENGTMCEMATDSPGRSRTGVAQAYGYGFLMIVMVCLCSLFGLLFVPLVIKNKKLGQMYKLFYALMVALGASALFCDAVLHLIPEAFGLHSHSVEEPHGHEGEEEEAEDKTFIWKGCVIVAGTYIFFVFETILHAWNQHSHSHGIDSGLNSKEDDTNVSISLVNEGESEAGEGKDFNSNKDTNTSTTGILHPKESSTSDHKRSKSPPPKTHNHCMKLFYYIKNIKPLAWMIILGDALHNFADGLALGAAIVQNLSLGLSTMIALIFHEIPHELGDFFILISTGMKWYIALLFNFFSALTAILGFFVGVAISTQSEDATGWILGLAAGVFLYIALVDLLPELINSKEKGLFRWGMFTMANIGMFLSFLALLLLAIYEDQLNTLVSV